MTKNPRKNTPPYKIFLFSGSKEQKLRSVCSLGGIEYKLSVGDDYSQAQAILNKEEHHLVVIDLDDYKKSYEFFEWVIEVKPDINIIGITDTNPLDVVVNATRAGIQSIFNTSSNLYPLQKRITTFYESWRQNRDRDEFLEKQKQKYGFSNIIGQSPQMRQIFDLIERIMRRKWATVLIRGETGTGKELIARSIHYSTCTPEQPFVEINCSALPESLLESELFGYEKGAFTDAKTTKAGLFELAHNGTLFLDEIGEITPKVQIKLLKALEEKTIRRLGGVRDIKISTRIISATNRNLQDAIKSGQFRNDLFYRLNVLYIDVPPLRERGDDVLLLARYFLKQFAEEYDSPLQAIEPEAEQLLKQYPWPGNVRELRHTIERISLLSDGITVTRKELENTIDSETPLILSEKKEKNYLHIEIPPEGVSLEDAEKVIIKQILKKTGWNKRRTCRILKISRPRLDRKIQKFNLNSDSL
ncbi:sigma-54-dependent Fis family transcriptional regulator [candidate division KSB1 bacterium]|nr:sigma-54-dependent Fis family transcriptional regulator [candidate division KSB1 bacterium]RQW01819.1 MAG: sigma-54-dependent Fis family transcriptional regulator [candidate division KSB1 bacterium]